MSIYIPKLIELSREIDTEKVVKLVLSSHYFNKYLDFIQKCKLEDKETGDFENHHILPKAKDLFPEYKSFRENSWNKAKLTPRQHYIAHWMLWKAFGKSQAYAFMTFKNQAKCKNNKRLEYTITSRVYENVKIENKKYMREINLGMATYVDLEGNKIRCKTDDPRVLSGILISTTKGRKYKPRTKEQKLKTKESLLNFHRNKEKQPDVYLYKREKRIKIIKHSSDYYIRLNQGLSERCTKEFRSFSSAETNRSRPKAQWSDESKARVSERLKGKKQKTEHIRNAALGRRSNTDKDENHYKKLAYDTIDKVFKKIDILDIDGIRYIKASKRTKGSRKIENVLTGEVLFLDPGIPTTRKLPVKKKHEKSSGI